MSGAAIHHLELLTIKDETNLICILLSERVSLVRFILFVLYQSLLLKQPRWADGKQFRWAQKQFSKMKIFNG